MKSPKPEALKVLRDNIPDELKAINNWLCWKYVWNGKKWDKPPINSKNGRAGSSTNPETWADFETAFEQYNFNGWDGIGFALTKDLKRVGIDYDDCLDETGKIIKPEVEDHIKKFDSYTEKSPSGTGLRMFVIGSLSGPGVNNRPKGIEMYDTGRYLTITGAALNGSKIQSRQEHVDLLYKQLAPKVTATPPPPVKDQDELFAEYREMISDLEYIDFFKERSKRFKKLFNEGPDSSSGMSHSDNDWEFCCIIAKYIKDPVRIDSLYRKSKLMRPKWDGFNFDGGKTRYGEGTIRNALAHVVESWDPDLNPVYMPGKHEIIKAFADNEVGDASIFVKQNRGRYIYDHAAKKWSFWAGNYWAEDSKRFSLTEVYNVSKAYEKHDFLDEKDKSVYGQRISALRSLVRQKRVLEIAASGKHGLGLTGNEWDKKPYLMACMNGVIDLKTGKLRTGKQEDYLRTHCPISYNPDAPRPEQFLDKFLPGFFDGHDDVDAMIDYLITVLGMSLIGEQVEHAMFVFYGQHGRNGKTVLFQTLRNVLGDGFVINFGPNFLTKQRYETSRDAAKPAMAAMRGKRFVLTSENDEDRDLDVSFIKELTGGGPQEARGLYEGFFNFDPAFTVFLATNKRPRADFNDSALWYRMHTIELYRSFIDDPVKDYERQRIPNMVDLLKKEAEGILKVLVEGCLKYQKKGKIEKPDAVKENTNRHRMEQDQIGHYILERIKKKEGEIGATDFYNDYRIWAKKKYYTVLTMTKFGTLIKEFIDSHEGRGKRIYYEAELVGV